MKTVEMIFDFVSPASYLAFTQIPAVAERTGAAIIWTPVFLGAVMKAAGSSSPITVPAKGRWMLVDFQRYATEYGVVFKMNPHFPFNTMAPLRIACALLIDKDERAMPFMTAVYDAIWVDGKDMSDEAVLASVITDAGLDAEALLPFATRQDAKDLLKANTESAVARGVFGNPTFFVDEDMFFGQDRLHHVERALRA
ncbi:MAG: 2-hydroxychromene-2-carboxylate isomerase [Pseudomonadota bacterium]